MKTILAQKDNSLGREVIIGVHLEGSHESLGELSWLMYRSLIEVRDNLFRLSVGVDLDNYEWEGKRYVFESYKDLTIVTDSIFYDDNITIPTESILKVATARVEYLNSLTVQSVLDKIGSAFSKIKKSPSNFQVNDNIFSCHVGVERILLVLDKDDFLVDTRRYLSTLKINENLLPVGSGFV